MKQYRIIWRKINNKEELRTIWQDSESRIDYIAETIRKCGNLVIRKETREINLTKKEQDFYGRHYG